MLPYKRQVLVRAAETYLCSTLLKKSTSIPARTSALQADCPVGYCRFLPKGRKNANETLTAAAEREAFEEAGYRNRVLPLPMQHRQPDPDTGHEKFVSEPLWTQLLPLSSRSQYILCVHECIKVCLHYVESANLSTETIDFGT